MESKKIKKLVLNKETVSLLNDYQLSKHKGGREEETGLSPCYPSYDGNCETAGGTCDTNCWQFSCFNGCTW